MAGLDITLPTEIQDLLDIDDNPTGTTANRLDVSTAELVQVFAENFPYFEKRTINGAVYIWNTAFIKKCTDAMSNGDLSDMNTQELAVWDDYVAWSDAMSTSATDAMCFGNAVGCTIIDEFGKSYAVCSDGTITTEECIDGDLSYNRETILKSLDSIFVNILNCLPYNVDDVLLGDITDVSTCDA